MSTVFQGTAIAVGDDIYDDDGEKLGSVAGMQDKYVVVEKGFFFPTDYYIPVDAISRVEDGKIYLTVAKEHALSGNWGAMPVDTLAYSEPMVTDAASNVAPDEYAVDRPTAAYEVADEDEVVIPIIEEELSATVREQEAGAVRIEKRVITEDRVIDVPVTEEQIRVERRVVDRDAGTLGADAFEEIVIEVPLTEETVELHKEARVTGEVVVSKEAVERTERVTGTVRREEVVIDESDIDADQRSGAF